MSTLSNLFQITLKVAIM